jgi:cell division septal protein FtsQ
MALPWVRDAALRRSLPSTVDVFISERQPIGLGRINVRCISSTTTPS